MKILTPHQNKYPIFIPTKGRHESRLTIKLFDRLGIDYTIVVEPQQLDDYLAVCKPDIKYLVTPHRDKGLTETRNFIWDYAESLGVKRFWTFDDNIQGLFRHNRNLNVPVADGTILRVIEDFADRYENLHLTGMNYFMFASRKSKLPPFTMNTRVYSNMLLRTDAKDKHGVKFRNNLFYNDDTDLCLRMLKSGFPIVQFNAFLIDKAQTMTVKGGMTDYYQSDECEGRKKFVEELMNAHPECVELTWKFNRWHHQVDYSVGKRNRLIRVPEYDQIVQKGVNNYGMELIYIDEK